MNVNGDKMTKTDDQTQCCTQQYLQTWQVHRATASWHCHWVQSS